MSHSEKIKLKQKNLRSLHAGDQHVEPWMTPLGLFLRIAAPALFAVGLFLFTDNAFGLGAPKLLFVPLIVGCVCLSVFMHYFRAVTVAGWILLAGGFGAFFALSGANPLTAMIDMARGFFNTAVSYMMKVGYRTLYVFLLPTDYTQEAEAALAVRFFFLVTAVVALIVGACCAKRVKVFPLAVIAAVDYFVIFMYNISTSKWGFAMSLAGIAGILCQRMADNAAAYAQPDAAEDSADTTHAAISDDSRTAAAVADGNTAKKKKKTPNPQKAPLSEEEKEARRTAHKRDLRGYAVGGVCSCFVSLLILAILAIPASRVKNIWRTYESIDTIMETIRAYEMAIITGEDMQITDLGLTGAAEILEARSAIAQPRYFTGKPVLEVQSNASIPIYLRSWISTTYEGDRWYVANDAQRDEFKQRFGTDFRAEDITYRFFRNLNDKLVRYNSATSYVNHEDDGYITTLVSIKNLGVTGNILFLPERFDSERALFDYGTVDTPYSKRWINYFDGIAYSRAFHKGAKYSAVAYLPLYKDEDWMQNLNEKRMDYDRFCSLYEFLGDTIALYDSDIRGVQLLVDAYGAKNTEERAAFEAEMKEVFAYNDYVLNSDLYTSLNVDEALGETLRALAEEIVCSTPLADTGIIIDPEQRLLNGMRIKDCLPELSTYDYTDFLYCTDLALQEFYAKVSTAAADATDEDDVTILWTPVFRLEEVRGSDHSLIDNHYYITDYARFTALVEIMEQSHLLPTQIVATDADTSRMVTYYYPFFTECIAKYLADNMTYTLNPTPPEEGDPMSAVERFLFVTKEGYCVQYATAATLLLRSLGVPTRYVEGYIAPKMVRNNPENPEDKIGTYIGTVRDYNAHAWVEIYLPNYGWLMQEVTTPYYSTMNDPYERLNYTHREPTSGGIVEVPVEEEDEEEDVETFWEVWGELIITLSVVGAIVLVIGLLAAHYLSRQSAKRFHHDKLLRDAKRDNIADADRTAAAEALYDTLLRLVRQFGMKPVKGEVPADFAHRLDLRFPLKQAKAEDILPIIEKNEFGGVLITPEEIAEFAAYIDMLEEKIREEAGFFKMLLLKYGLGLMK